MKFTIGINRGDQVRLRINKKYTVVGKVLDATAKTATVEWPDEPGVLTYHKSSLRKVFNPILAIKKQIRRMISILGMLLIFAAGSFAQEKPYDPVKAQITVGAVNFAYMVYMNQKQNFIPVETQKWLNWIVTVPVITFTLYKSIEWQHKTHLCKWYKPPHKKSIKIRM